MDSRASRGNKPALSNFYSGVQGALLMTDKSNSVLAGLAYRKIYARNEIETGSTTALSFFFSFNEKLFVTKKLLPFRDLFLLQQQQVSSLTTS